MPCSALDGLADCQLHRRTPFGITNVSQTQLSISRYSGGCRFDGEYYVYLPHTDELIRDDVRKWKLKMNKPKRLVVSETLLLGVERMGKSNAARPLPPVASSFQNAQ